MSLGLLANYLAAGPMCTRYSAKSISTPSCLPASREYWIMTFSSISPSTWRRSDRDIDNTIDNKKDTGVSMNWNLLFIGIDFCCIYFCENFDELKVIFL